MFGSSKKTYVGTSAVRLIEDAMVPDATKQSLIEYVLSEDQSQGVTPYLLDSVSKNLGNSQKKAFNYAEKNLPYGLPSKLFTARNRAVSEVKRIITEEEGSEIDLVYSKYGLPNFYHWVWEHLLNTIGYNQQTGEVPSKSNADTIVFLEGISINADEKTLDKYEPFVLERWINPLKPLNFSMGMGNDIGSSIIRSNVYDRVYTGKGQTTTGTIHLLRVSRKNLTAAYPSNLVAVTAFTREIVTIDLPILEESDVNYYQVHYKVGGESKLVTYRSGTGRYPSLDTWGDVQPTVGQFYPWVYFRYDKKQLNVSPEDQSSEYKPSKKYCSILGLDYDDLANNIHDNPDIDDIEQAMLMYAVLPDTTNGLELQYLFEFFDALYYELPTLMIGEPNPSASLKEFSVSGISSSPRSDWSYSGYRSSNSIDGYYSLEIKDKKFRMALIIKALEKRLEARQIGPIGKVIYNLRSVKRTVQVAQDNGEAGPSMGTEVVYDDVHEYIKQISEFTCEVVSVTNLNTRFYVYDQYSTIGDDTKDTNLIPLDFAIAKKFSYQKREKLIARSMHLIFNSRVVVKVKWYQSMFFQFVLLVVAVVMTIVSYGAAAQAFFAGIAAGTISAVAAIQTILAALFKTLVVNYAFKFVVDKIGGEFAAVIAVVLLVYSIYEGFQAGSFANTFTKLGTGLIDAVSNKYKDGIEEISKELELLQETYAELYESLDKTSKELLQQSVAFSPLIIFGETPDEYYNRTVHSGNIAVRSIEYIENFVQEALKLPDSKQLATEINQEENQ